MAAYALAPPDPGARAVTADVSSTWTALYAAICCVIAARRRADTDQRNAWWWLAAGCALFLGGLVGRGHRRPVAHARGAAARHPHSRRHRRVRDAGPCGLMPDESGVRRGRAVRRLPIERWARRRLGCRFPAPRMRRRACPPLPLLPRPLGAAHGGPPHRLRTRVAAGGRDR